MENWWKIDSLFVRLTLPTLQSNVVKNLMKDTWQGIGKATDNNNWSKENEDLNTL